jgi:hypothetical protein
MTIDRAEHPTSNLEPSQRVKLAVVPTYQPVKTRFGLLRGREALEATSLLLTATTLRLEGVLNADYSGEGSGLHRFRLEFDDVRSYRVTALDDFRGDLTSSLDEVLSSAWLEAVQDAQRWRHYQVITVEYALEVLARGARMRVGELEGR